MQHGIELDFNHPIANEAEQEAELYVRVLGSFSKEDNEVQHTFTLSKNVNCEDISEIIEVIDPELYNEITEEIDIRIDKYICEAVAEWKEGGLHD